MKKFDDDDIDLSDPLLNSIVEKDRARRRVMERVEAKYIRSDRDVALEMGISSLIERMVTLTKPDAPPAAKKGREGHSLVVIGESGAGKSTALERHFSRHPAFPGYGVQRSGCPLVTVTVDDPCTLKQLGRQLLDEIGYPLMTDKKEHIVWEMARARVASMNIRVIHFDEIQNVSKCANIIEADKIRGTLKSLMNDKRHPVCLVLSGMPEFKTFIEEDAQNVRRSDFIEFGALTTSDLETVRETIKGLSSVAKLAVDPKTVQEIAPRLMHASTYQMGIAIEMVQQAIENALRADARTLTEEDFATMFARRTGNAAPANPFIAPNWHEIDCSKPLQKDAARPPVEQPRPTNVSNKRRAKARNAGRGFK